MIHIHLRQRGTSNAFSSGVSTLSCQSNRGYVKTNPTTETPRPNLINIRLNKPDMTDALTGDPIIRRQSNLPMLSRIPFRNAIINTNSEKICNMADIAAENHYSRPTEYLAEHHQHI